MSRQVKCINCSTWNDEALINCSNCSKFLTTNKDEPIIENKSDSYKEFVGKIKGQSDWIDKFFIKAKTGNVFMKGLAYFLQFLWMVYFSLILFVAWLVFIIAG